MSKFNTKEFKALKSIWDKKLSDSGFDDLEPVEGYLKIWSYSFRAQPLVWAQSKHEYYSMAGKFLNDYSFTTPTEKHVWDMHSRGIGVRQIIKFLKANKLAGHNNLVNEIIKRFRKLMIKMYE